MSAERGNDGPYPLEEPDASVAALTSRVADQTGELVRSHIELAKVEIIDEVRSASEGAGLLGAGAFTAVLGVLMLSFAAAWGLAEVIPVGAAFAVIGVLWLIGAAILALVGRRKVQQVDPVPRATVEEMKEDTRWVREQTN